MDSPKYSPSSPVYDYAPSSPPQMSAQNFFDNFYGNVRCKTLDDRFFVWESNTDDKTTAFKEGLKNALANFMPMDGFNKMVTRNDKTYCNNVSAIVYNMFINQDIRLNGQLYGVTFRSMSGMLLHLNPSIPRDVKQAMGSYLYYYCASDITDQPELKAQILAAFEHQGFKFENQQ